MSGSNTRNLAIAVGVILVGIFLANRKGSKSLRPAALPKASSAPSSATTTSQVQILDNSDLGRSSESTELRNKYNRMLMTGLVEVPVSSNSAELRFKIRPKTKPVWCATGDFDSIKSLAGKIGLPQFLLSIEPLSGNKANPSKFRMSAFDIFSGKPFEAILPKDSGSRDYGVYLCLDTAKTNECGSKKVISSNDWKRLSESKKNKDVLIYFQMVTVTNNRAYLIPSQKWNQPTIDSLKETLKSILQSAESLDTLQHHMNLLQSVPAQVNQNILEVVLPYRAKGC